MRKILSVSAVALVSALLASPAFAAKTAVMVYSDEIIVLKEAVAASGARYVGENFQLWSNGKNELNLASISEDDAVKGKVAEDKGRTCKLVK